MDTMFRSIIFYISLLFCAGPAWADTACFEKTIEGRGVDGKPYPVALSPAWPDERILQALKLDVRDASVTRAIGPDGFGVFYEYPGTKVSIGHSVSDGITVMLSKNGTTIIWELGLCRS